MKDCVRERICESMCAKSWRTEQVKEPEHLADESLNADSFVDLSIILWLNHPQILSGLMQMSTNQFPCFHSFSVLLRPTMTAGRVLQNLN